MQHHGFYQPGRKYRAPGFVATSFTDDVARSFAQRARESGLPAVLWVVHMHPEGRRNPKYACKHVNLVRKTHVAGEAEYLFSPYSVFTVRSVLIDGPPCCGACAARVRVRVRVCAYPARRRQT